MTEKPAQTDTPVADLRPAQPKTTGHYTEDCALGRQYADDLVSYLTTYSMRPYLIHAVRDLIDAADDTGIVVGFFHRLGDHATS